MMLIYIISVIGVMGSFSGLHLVLAQNMEKIFSYLGPDAKEICRPYVELIKSSDRNGDGDVTMQEIGEKLADIGKNADTNRDGRLDPDEFAAATGLPSGLLSTIDQNSDGIISVDEGAEFFPHLNTVQFGSVMALVDVNKDQIMNSAEIGVMVEAVGESN